MNSSVNDEDRLRAEIWGPSEARRVVVRREVIEEVAFAEQVVLDHPPQIRPEPFEERHLESVFWLLEHSGGNDRSEGVPEYLLAYALADFITGRK